ncbi:MAG: hypothetical protein EXQ67_04550 [Thermoleophilia bacterium]|nr:hypothetical protein [Thermoleophilia bacterium]
MGCDDGWYELIPISTLAHQPVHELLHDQLPAYCAGSLPRDWHTFVESELLCSPSLLAEAMELMRVNEHLLEVRRTLDAEA